MKISGKIISMVLAVVMVFSLTVPAFAADRIENEQTPIIYIRGNGEPLYNAQGERIAAEIEDISLGGDDEDEEDGDSTLKTVIESLLARIVHLPGLTSSCLPTFATFLGLMIMCVLLMHIVHLNVVFVVIV